MFLKALPPACKIDLGVANAKHNESLLNKRLHSFNTFNSKFMHTRRGRFSAEMLWSKSIELLEHPVGCFFKTFILHPTLNVDAISQTLLWKVCSKGGIRRGAAV